MLKAAADSQDRALQLALAGQNLFITGGAGVGKSFLLRRVIVQLRKLHPLYGQVVVCASTGIAATHISGECAAHSPAAVLSCTQRLKLSSLQATQCMLPWALA